MLQRCELKELFFWVVMTVAVVAVIGCWFVDCQRRGGRDGSGGSDGRGGCGCCLLLDVRPCSSS